MASRLVRDNCRPRDVVTHDAVENAITSVVATGGSTNAVLHLLAIAHEAGVELEIDDFDVLSRRVPLLADLKPGGQFVASDMYDAGGTPLLAQRLLNAGLLHPDARTVSGRTVAGAAVDANETACQILLHCHQHQVQESGGLVI